MGRYVRLYVVALSPSSLSDFRPAICGPGVRQSKATSPSYEAARGGLFVPHSSGKNAGKLQEEDFYDVPPSDPLQGPTPIYSR